MLCPLLLQVHVCSPQRCRHLSSRCDIYQCSRHIYTFGWCCRKCSHQEALPAECWELGRVLYKRSHRTFAWSCWGSGGSFYCSGLLPWGPAPNSQPGPHRTRVQPELCPLQSTAMAESGLSSCPHKLFWVWGHQRFIVSQQFLMIHWEQLLVLVNPKKVNRAGRLNRGDQIWLSLKVRFDRSCFHYVL